MLLLFVLRNLIISHFAVYICLIKLRLSHEHQGFIFEPDITKAVDLLVHHSGGKVSTALGKAIEQREIKNVEVVQDIIHNNIDLTDKSKIVGNPIEREDSEFSEKEGGRIFNCLNCC